MDQTDLEAYIYEGEWDEVEKHIENGGDVNLVNENGKSLLHFAVERERPGIVRMLLNNDADINLQDTNGKTPLHYAVDMYVENYGSNLQSENEAMIKLLVRRGADIYIEDSQGNSSFDLVNDYEEDHDAYELTEWMETSQARWNNRQQHQVAVNLPSRNLPTGSSNSISYENIKEGNTMVNFLNESKQGRYYKKATYNKFVTNQTIGKKRNPFTRAPIHEITQYKAHLLGGGKRNTKKLKKSKKSKKTRKH